MNAGHPLGGSPIGSQLAYWAFDEQQGQVINSRTNGTTYNGTLGATSGSSTDDPTWKPLASCKRNGCLEFDGTSDYTTAVGNEENQFSIAMWIKPDAVTSRGIAGMAESPGSDTHDRDLYFDANSKIAGKVYDGGNKFVRSTTTAVAGNWYHIIMTYNGTNLQLYINGKLESTTAAGNPYSNYATPEYIIGRTYSLMGLPEAFISNVYFDGHIDDIQFYSAALTSSEVLIVMNANSTVNLGTGTNEAADLSGGAGNAPLLYWAYDENTGSTATDLTGNNRSGTITGTVWVPGKKGSGLIYDGDDHVRTADNALDGMSSAGSMSFWFNTTSTTESLMVSNEGYHAVYMNFNNVSGKIAAFFDGSSGGNPATTAAFNDGLWHHLAATNNGTTTKVYVDGVKVLDFAETFAAPSSTQPFAAGSQHTGSGSFYTGTLDDIKAFDYALSEAQIAYDYNRGGPIGHWKLDECTGTTAYDSSGNSLNGTITIGGTGTYTAAGTCASGTSTHAWNGGTTGKRNSSLGFDGTNDFITMGSNAKLAQAQFTVSLWTKKTTSNTTDVLFSNGPDNNAGSYRIITTSSGLPSCLAGATGSTKSVDGPSALTNGVWHHLSATYDGTTIRCYVNGALIGSSSSGTYTAATLEATIGKQPYASFEYYADALIDDVRVYNYALSVSQLNKVINDNASARFGPVEGSP